MASADPRAAARFLAAFFDELSRWGVRDVVVSPGSRSTPLSMTAYELSRRAPERMRVFVDVDERGAAFVALGMAKASGRPAAIICTSGTAVANYYPAVMEAESSRVPLIVLTGDRPPRLQGLGAPQTCDQLHAYGTHVRSFRQMPLPADDADSIALARQAAREACIDAGADLPSHGTAAGEKRAESGGSPYTAGAEWDWRGSAREPRIAGSCFGGPVHVNFPFEEPLKPDFTVPGLFAAVPEDADAVSVASSARIAGIWLTSGRTIVLAGEGTCSTLGEAREVVAWARAFDLPLFADPLSGLRAIDDPIVIDCYDSILEPGGVLPESILDEQHLPEGNGLAPDGDGSLAEGEASLSGASKAALDSTAAGSLRGRPHWPLPGCDLNPQVIVRFGRYPLSKKATQFAAAACRAGARQVVVDPLETRDFNASTGAFVPCKPIEFVRATRADAPDVRGSYAQAWIDVNAAAERRIARVDTAQGARRDRFEGAYVRRAVELAPEGSLMFAANSMSVRALDTFYPKGKKLTVLANRGLNGIDGTVSTAIGAAQSFDRTTLVIGDLAMLHDVNALALQRELRVKREERAALCPSPAPRTSCPVDDAGAQDARGRVSFRPEGWLDGVVSPDGPGITIVLLNNNGGGIFDMLPQKSRDPYFERLFLTPQDVDFQLAAGAFGVPHCRVRSVDAFEKAYRASLGAPGITLIEVPIPLSGLSERYEAYW